MSEKVLSIKGMIEHLDMYMYGCSKCSCGEESHSCFKEEIMVVGRVRLIIYFIMHFYGHSLYGIKIPYTSHVITQQASTKMPGAHSLLIGRCGQTSGMKLVEASKLVKGACKGCI